MPGNGLVFARRLQKPEVAGEGRKPGFPGSEEAKGVRKRGEGEESLVSVNNYGNILQNQNDLSYDSRI